MQGTTAIHRLIWAVIIGAVLYLPLGNLAAAAVQPPGCPHCQGVPAGLTAAHCCCSPGMPGPCGACGSGGLLTCRCPSGSLVFISTPAAGATTWPVAPYTSAMVAMPVKLFPPNIFHPPELTRLSS
jgi:hypothetical protein